VREGKKDSEVSPAGAKEQGVKSAVDEAKLGCDRPGSQT